MTSENKVCNLSETLHNFSLNSKKDTRIELLENEAKSREFYDKFYSPTSIYKIEELEDIFSLNFYFILNLSEQKNKKEISEILCKNFRKKIKKHHPDFNKQAGSKAIYNAITTANLILGSKFWRAKYDKYFFDARKVEEILDFYEIFKKLNSKYAVEKILDTKTPREFYDLGEIKCSIRKNLTEDPNADHRSVAFFVVFEYLLNMLEEVSKKPQKVKIYEISENDSKKLAEFYKFWDSYETVLTGEFLEYHPRYMSFTEYELGEHKKKFVKEKPKYVYEHVVLAKKIVKLAKENDPRIPKKKTEKKTFEDENFSTSDIELLKKLYKQNTVKGRTNWIFVCRDFNKSRTQKIPMPDLVKKYSQLK